jgi:hypothetical protein
MIGELINKFESLENQTVEEFNKLFPMSPLNYPKHSVISIGNLYGNSREIIIGNETIYHEITVLKSFTKSGLRKLKQVKLFEKNGNLIGEYVGITSIPGKLNLSVFEFYDRLKTGEYFIEEVA